MATSAYELLAAYVSLTARGMSETMAAITAVENAVKRITNTPANVALTSNAQSVLVATEAVEATWERTNAAISQVNSQLAITQQRVASIAAASASRPGAAAASAAGSSANPALSAIRSVTTSASASQSAFAGAASSAAGFVTQLAGVAAAAAVAGVAIQTLREGVAEAFSQERSRIAFTALTGSAEQTLKIMNDLANFAQESPFTFPELRETAQRMLAVGVSADTLVETLKNLSQVASISGADLNLLTKAYTDVLAKGRLSAQELNQFANANVPLLKELELLLKRPREEIRRLAEDGLISADMVTEAFQRMTSEGGKLSGVLESINSLAPESLSNIAEDAKQIAAHLTRWSIGLFKEELEAVRDVLDLVERGLRRVTGFAAEDIPDNRAATTAALIEQQSAVTRALFRAARLTTFNYADSASDALENYIASIGNAADATSDASKREVASLNESRAAAQLRMKEAQQSAIVAEEAAAKIVDAWEKSFRESDRKFTQFWRGIQRRMKQESDQQLSDTISQLQGDTRAADALRESLMSPMDEFKAKIAEAQQLLEKGLISDETFTGVFNRASKELDDIKRKVSSIQNVRTSFIVGQSGELSFRMQASRTQDLQLIEAKQQSKMDAERNRILSDIRNGLQQRQEQAKPEVSAETFPTELF